MANFVDFIEKEELMNKLRKSGLGEIIDAFLMNESKVYTKKGRLNKSGACRVLKVKPKQLEDWLTQCKEILSKDFEEEIMEE